MPADHTLKCLETSDVASLRPGDEYGWLRWL